MIKEGQRKKARYWGNFTVKKVAKLRSPVPCYSKEVGEVEFMPTIVQIEWDVSPSSDKNEFWLPYWVKIRGKEKYGQFAPMIGKNALLRLLKEAIRQDFFDQEFLKELAESIQSKLEATKDDGIDFFLDLMRKTTNESWEKACSECDTLARCAHLWTDIAIPLIHRKSAQEIGYFEHKLLSFTFKGLMETFVMGVSGAYLNAFRTLRFIFEMLVQAHVLENFVEGVKGKDKLARILSTLQDMDEHRRSFKVKMISELKEFTEEEKSDLKELYGLLSRYVHPTIEHFEIDAGAAIPFSFDHDELKKVAHAMVGVADLMTTLAMLVDSELAKELDECARNDIEELDMSLSKRRLG